MGIEIACEKDDILRMIDIKCEFLEGLNEDNSNPNSDSAD